MNKKDFSEQNSQSVNPILPPPVIYLITLFLGIFLQQLYPIGIEIPQAIKTFSIVLFLLFLSLAFYSVFQLRSQKTAVNPYKPTTQLVRTGVYKYSRNPIYTSLFLMHILTGLVAKNLWIFILSFLYLLLIHYLVVLREESCLQKIFNEAYKDYTQKTRRYF